MKKIFFAIFAITLLLSSCSNDDIITTTTPKTRTLTYVVNTQSLYDDLGITSEITNNYLSNNYKVGVYTFIYDSEQNLITTKSSIGSSLAPITETFQMKEGSYTIVSYETLVGNDNTPSWSGQEKLTTLTFNDYSSNDYHYTSGTVETKVALIGGVKTETVSPAATRHLLTLNIGTQSMYDTFGRSSYENVWLSNDYNYYVGVTSLVYDNSGQFVDSINTYVKTFQSVQQKFSLRDGNYTIVTVETLVNGDTRYTSDYWKIDNVQNLSDLVLMNSEYSSIYWDGIVGISSCIVPIRNSNQSQSVIPAAIGSLVNVTAANFDKSNYSFIEFCTKNAPDGIMLSPNVSEKYYYINYEKSNYWIIRGFMGNLSTYVFPESTGMTVYIIESGAINWGLGCANESYLREDGRLSFDRYPKGDNYYPFQDGQIYSAYIRYRGDEKGCDANIGTENEISTWIDGLEPIVSNDALFAEPYIKWGGSVASVKSYMSGYRAFNDGNVKEESGSFVLTYYGKYQEDQIRYWFTSQTDGLTDVLVFFDSQKVGEDDLLQAFAEMEYELLSSDEESSTYRTKDNTSYVEIGLNNNNLWYVWYSRKSNSAVRRNTEKTITELAPKQTDIKSIKSVDYNYVKNQLQQCGKIMKIHFK